MKLRTVACYFPIVLGICVLSSVCLYYHLVYQNYDLNQYKAYKRWMESDLPPKMESYSLMNRAKLKPSANRHLHVPGRQMCPARLIKTETDLDMEAIFAELGFTRFYGGYNSRGYPISYALQEWDNKPLEVFIVPHSHQDPGWRYTVEQYFRWYSKPSLDSTLHVLTSNPKARFIYAEISFLSKWFDTLNSVRKEAFKRLIENGQWEITSGGWVMPDEAGTHYYAIIDQMIEGNHWLLDHLNYRPNTSWSIDPFGQSLTMPYLLKKMGFPSMVINRVHYEVKRYMSYRNSLEFVWRQPWDLFGTTDMFTHLFPYFSYGIAYTCGPNPNICWEFDFMGDGRIEITDDNVAERAQTLANQYRLKANLFRNGNLVLIPLGDDFRYRTIAEWHMQLDNYEKLINYFDKHPELKIKARISTLSDYFTAVHRRSHASIGKIPETKYFPSFQGDFFTYADRNQDFWSGYFTSRPYQKWLSRLLESELRCAEILFAFSLQNAHLSHSDLVLSQLYENLVEVRRIQGLFQHHDSITGTSRKLVVAEHTADLLKSIAKARKLSAFNLAHLLMFLNKNESNIASSKDVMRTHYAKHLLSIPDTFEPIPMFNVMDETIGLTNDVLRIADTGNPSPIYLFNPSNIERTIVASIHIPSDLKTVRIVDSDDRDSDLVRVQLENVDYYVDRVHFGPIKVPAFGAKRLDFFYLPLERSMELKRIRRSLKVELDYTPEMENDMFRLIFHRETGMLRFIYNKMTKQFITVELDFLLYDSADGPSNSGHYLFIPAGPGRPIGKPESFEHLQGPLMDEISVNYKMVEHRIRLYKTNDLQGRSIEIENFVKLYAGRIANSEIAMAIKTNIQTGTRTFYTDSNCYQYVKREYLDKIPLQGNVYPAACGVYIEQTAQSSQISDQVTRLNLFTSHPLGVTSPVAGTLHIWLDRRLSRGDGRGVGCVLRTGDISVSQLRLVVEQIAIGSQDQTYVPSLSLLAQRIQLDLLQPIRRFIPNQKASVAMALNLNLIPNFGIPCNYELVNLRIFHRKTNMDPRLMTKSNHVLGLILRRFAPICTPEIEIPGEIDKTCTEFYYSPVDLSTTFANLGITHAVKAKLNMMPSDHPEQGQKLSNIVITPMEMDAYFLV